MNMGQKINALRVQRGYTLQELGNRVGVGASTIRKWETGFIENVKADKVEKLAKALDVSPGYVDPKEGEDAKAWRRRIISCFVSEVYLWNDRIVIFFNLCGLDGKLKSVDRRGFDERPNCSTIADSRRTRIAILSYGFALVHYLAKKS